MKDFFPAIGWGVILFFLSVLPGVPLPPPPLDVPGPDKLAHALAYFVLSAALLWGFYRRGKPRTYQIAWAVGISTGYGLFLEIIQWGFFPYRYFELYDILSNIIGAIAGIVIIFFIK